MDNDDYDNAENCRIISADTLDIPPHPTQIFPPANIIRPGLNRRYNYPANDQSDSGSGYIGDAIPILVVIGSILIIIGSFLICWPVGAISLILFLWWKLR